MAWKPLAKELIDATAALVKRRSQPHLEDALLVLESAGQGAASYFQDVVPLLADSDRHLAGVALRTAQAIADSNSAITNSAVITSLSTLADKLSPEERFRFACALFPFIAGPTSVEGVQACLTNAGSSAATQEAYLASIKGPLRGHSADQVDATVSVIRKLALSGSAGVRVAAIRALGAIGRLNEADIVAAGDVWPTTSSCTDANEFASEVLAVGEPSLAIGRTAIALSERTGCASDAIGQLLDRVQNPELLVPIIARSLNSDTDAGTHVAEALGSAPRLRQRLASVIVPLAASEDVKRRTRAVLLLKAGTQLSAEHIQALVVAAENERICCEALDALALQGRAGQDHVAKLERLLDSPDPIVKAHAALTLGALGATGPTAATLKSLVESADTRVQVAAIAALADTTLLHSSGDLLSRYVTNSNTADAAMAALARLGAAGRPYARTIAESLGTDRNDNAIRALTELAPVPDDALLVVLRLVVSDSKNRQQYRFLTYLLASASTRTSHPAFWFGLDDAQIPQLTTPMAREAIAMLLRLWRSTSLVTSMREPIAAQLNRVVARSAWDYGDMALLAETRDIVELTHGDSAAVTQAMRWLRVRQALRTGGFVAVLHLGLWITLLILYPRSEKLQAMLFWNRPFRRVLGAFYVDWLIVWVPGIRARLMAPFVQRLTEDARVSFFRDESGLIADEYFRGSLVEFRDRSTGELVSTPIVQALPEIKGHILLEGESGLGKSIFIRDLVRRAPRTVAYLPADRCAKGVLAALQEKLQGLLREEELLEAILYSGGLDLCIDGLNEVSPDTRAHISQFLRAHAPANILVATQPLLDWKPLPATYRLLPLDDNGIEAFLASREPTLPATAPIRGELFHAHCRTFIDRALDADQPAELLRATRLILSNPMDLTTAAQMVAEDQLPDLLGLQDQQYRVMAHRFRTATGRDFPLLPFAEMAYELRVLDRMDLDSERYPDELTVLAEHKMVLRQHFARPNSTDGTRVIFRHDKIMEFFLLQAFLVAGSSRAEEHLADSRFRGVYFLMAMKLPIENAALLREQLVLRAAETNDHHVSDRFIQLLESRRRLEPSRPAWIAGFDLPIASSLEAQVDALSRARVNLDRDLDDTRTMLQRARAVSNLLVEIFPHRAIGLLRDSLVETGLQDGSVMRISGSALQYEDVQGRAWCWTVFASTRTAESSDIARTFSETSQTIECRPFTKHVILVNADAASPPQSRRECAVDVDAVARSLGVAVVTSREWLLAIGRVTRGEIAPPRLFSALFDAIGIFQMVESTTRQHIG